MQRMKKRALIIAAALIGLVGCQQASPPGNAPSKEESSVVSPKPQNYVALPGQAATAASPTETITAFEVAAAAMGKTTTPPAVQPPTDAAEMTLTTQQDQAAAPIPEPRNVNDPSPKAETPNISSAPVGTAATISAAPHALPSTSRAPYAVQVTNGTSGRLFIEVQDDAGNIFPVGFMHAGQRVGTQPQDPQPIQGQLTVIVRDPDSPGAPEVRRYRVDPPPAYEGKTVGVTILPGGQYRASLDGDVYYSSPLPAEEQSH